MNRRDFMKGILAAGMAPAICRAENLMQINSRVLVPRYDLARDMWVLSVEDIHGNVRAAIGLTRDAIVDGSIHSVLTVTDPGSAEMMRITTGDGSSILSKLEMFPGREVLVDQEITIDAHLLKA